MVGWRGLGWLERGRGLRVDGSLEQNVLQFQDLISGFGLIATWVGVARDPMVLLPITRWRQASHLSC